MLGFGHTHTLQLTACRDRIRAFPPVSGDGEFKEMALARFRHKIEVGLCKEQLNWQNLMIYFLTGEATFQSSHEMVVEQGRSNGERPPPLSYQNPRSELNRSEITKAHPNSLKEHQEFPHLDGFYYRN
ncbi:hypothetical protein OROHE_000143 [Orobanche hederae]